MGPEGCQLQHQNVALTVHLGTQNDTWGRIKTPLKTGNLKGLHPQENSI